MHQLNLGTLLDAVKNKPNTKLILYQLPFDYMLHESNHFDFYNTAVSNKKLFKLFDIELFDFRVVPFVVPNKNSTLNGSGYNQVF